MTVPRANRNCELHSALGYGPSTAPVVFRAGNSLPVAGQDLPNIEDWARDNAVFLVSWLQDLGIMSRGPTGKEIDPSTPLRVAGRPASHSSLSPDPSTEAAASGREARPLSSSKVIPPAARTDAPEGKAGSPMLLSARPMEPSTKLRRENRSRYPIRPGGANSGATGETLTPLPAAPGGEGSRYRAGSLPPSP